MNNLEVNEFLAVNLMGYSRNFPFTGWWIGNISVGSFDPCSKIEQALGDGGSGTVAGEIRKLKGYLLIIDVYEDKTLATFVEDKNGIIMTRAGGRADKPSFAICHAAVNALRESSR